eukprot:631857-Hanusia_phi.AAC.1
MYKVFDDLDGESRKSLPPLSKVIVKSYFSVHSLVVAHQHPGSKIFVDDLETLSRAQAPGTPPPVKRVHLHCYPNRATSTTGCCLPSKT